MGKLLYQTVLKALRSSECYANQVVLTCGQLEKREFEQFKEVMGIIRGRWVGGKTQAFVFPDEIKPGKLIGQIVEEGVVPEKNKYSLYPTSRSVVEFVLDEVLDLDRFEYFEEVNFLEPSVGLGGIVIPVMERLPSCKPTLIEIDPLNCAMLRERDMEVIEEDFLNHRTEKKYQLIVMNPPFDNTTCANHFNHAFGMLSDGGLMACILPEGILDKTQIQPVAKMVDAINRYGEIERLPAKSFAPLTSIDTFVAKMESPKECSVDVVDRLVIHMKSDFEFYQAENEFLQKVTAVQTNLFGEIDDEQFVSKANKLIDNFMGKRAGEGLFFILTKEERSDLVEYLHERYKDSIYYADHG